MKKQTFMVLLIILAGCSGKERTDIQVTKVKRGIFMEEITDQGTVEAVNSISVSAPTISYRYGALKIAKIGKMVRRLRRGIQY